MSEKQLIIKAKEGGGQIAIDLPDNLYQVPLNRYLPFLREVEKLREMDAANEAAVIYSTVKAASEFTGIDIEDLARMQFGAGAAQSPELANNLTSLVSYIFQLVGTRQGKRLSTFNYKGETFCIPEFLTDSLGGVVLPNLTTIETIEAAEALRVARQEIEATKDPTGSHEFGGYLRLLAALCRKRQKDGTLETLPLGDVERDAFITNRAAHFSEISTGVALDVDFFLTSILRNSKTIRFADISLNHRSFVIVAEIFIGNRKPTKQRLHKAKPPSKGSAGGK